MATEARPFGFLTQITNAHFLRKWLRMGCCRQRTDVRKGGVHEPTIGGSTETMRVFLLARFMPPQMVEKLGIINSVNPPITSGTCYFLTNRTVGLPEIMECSAVNSRMVEKIGSVWRVVLRIVSLMFISSVLNPKWGWAMEKDGTLLYTIDGEDWSIDDKQELPQASPSLIFRSITYLHSP